MTHRILIDLLGFTGSRGGTETYAREICRRLPAAMPDGAFVAVTGRAGADRVRNFFPGAVHVVRWVGSDRVSWAAGEVFAADLIARRLGADLVWTPANMGPIVRGRRRVSTVHDATYHEGGGSVITSAVRRITAWLMGRTARTADAVISGSEAAADNVARHMGIPRDSIRIVPHGTNEPAAPSDPWSQLAALGVGADRPIVLSTGNRLPHKNFEGLIRAVAQLPAEERPLTVVTGGGADDPLVALVAELGLDRDVVLLGWVTTGQLESLYGVASLYVCPSTAEGFGLPVIDAMRRGCRVLANDIPVLREVGGDASLYADALNPIVLAEAISGALAAAPDDERVVAGRLWSEQFTWDRSAASTAAVFASVLADV